MVRDLVSVVRAGRLPERPAEEHGAIVAWSGMDVEQGRAPLGSWRVVTTGVAFGLAAMLVVTLVGAAGSHRLGFDFRAAYFPAAEAVRQGDSPYPPPGEIADADWHPYLYPPQLAIALVPSTFLPIDVAAFLAFVASLAAVLGALAVVGVRDARCYAVVLVWAPTWHALEMANLSAALTFALAILWRVREREWTGAMPLGLAVSVKLFLWPMLVWAGATRRIRLLGGALGVGFGITLAAWAAIGFKGLSAYPDLLLSAGDRETYSFGAVAKTLGVAPIVGDMLALLVGSGLLVLVALFGRRDEDSRAFICAVAAALALTPALWQHYLVLLAVPLAIERPQFSAIWLLPIALWMSPRAGNGGGVETVLPILVAASLVALLVARSARTGAVAEATS